MSTIELSKFRFKFSFNKLKERLFIYNQFGTLK